MPPSANRSAGPLAGIRIVDVTTMLLGPYATQMLADLGADVIKVEAPDGDGRRTLGPARHAGMASQFLHVNRGKRSIAIDLKRPEGPAIVLRLCERADALVHNSRRAAMQRLGLGYEDVARVNPGIVYCAAPGFGADGPYADKPAFDDMVQGLAAIPSLQARMGVEPRYLPFNFADRICGLALVNAVVSALLHRARTGEGQSVEQPMFETVAEFVLSEHMWGRTFRPPLGDMGAVRMFERRPAPTKDGHICFWTGTDGQAARLLDVIGRPEFKTDERFRTRAERNRNLGAYFDIVDAELAKKTTAEWIAALDAADVPAMPMHTPESLMDDPHLRAVGFLRDAEHPTEGPIVSMAVPSKWSRTQPAEPAPAPHLGEQSREVLREAGYGDVEIDRLFASGTVIGPDGGGGRNGQGERG